MDSIKLIYKERVQSFEFSHALKLLRLEAQLGVSNWQIHKDEKYKFENNELIRKRNTRTRKKQIKQ